MIAAVARNFVPTVDQFPDQRRVSTCDLPDREERSPHPVSCQKRNEPLHVTRESFLEGVPAGDHRTDVFDIDAKEKGGRRRNVDSGPRMDSMLWVAAQHPMILSPAPVAHGSSSACRGRCGGAAHRILVVIRPPRAHRRGVHDNSPKGGMILTLPKVARPVPGSAIPGVRIWGYGRWPSAIDVGD